MVSTCGHEPSPATYRIASIASDNAKVSTSSRTGRRRGRPVRPGISRTAALTSSRMLSEASWTCSIRVASTGRDVTANRLSGLIPSSTFTTCSPPAAT
jgi:hypothetical protein